MRYAHIPNVVDGVRAYAKHSGDSFGGDMLVVQSDPTVSKTAEAVRTSIQAAREEALEGRDPSRYAATDPVSRVNDSHFIKGDKAIAALVKNLNQAQASEGIMGTHDQDKLRMLTEGIRNRFQAHREARIESLTSLRAPVAEARQELLPWAASADTTPA